MKIISTDITDVKLLEPQVYNDERGCFFETFRQDWFKQSIAPVDFAQENHSHSLRGTLRGLHYQISRPQGKLIRVTSGEIFDVAVDLRQSSPTFGQWIGHYLSETNKRQLWVPSGFAHGFYVLSATADCHYKCTDYYAPEYEKSLIWDDPTLNIAWPLIEGLKPNLSPKDKLGQSFQANGHYYG